MDSGRSTGSQEESEFILQVRLAETLRGPNDSQGMPQLMSIIWIIISILATGHLNDSFNVKEINLFPKGSKKTNTIFMGL